MFKIQVGVKGATNINVIENLGVFKGFSFALNPLIALLPHFKMIFML